MEQDYVKPPQKCSMAIGSLPFTDTDTSLKFVWDEWNGIKHWPQLPGLGKKEGFVEQYLGPLVALNIIVESEKGKPQIVFDERLEEKIVGFYEKYLARSEENCWGENLFGLTKERAQGFVSFVEDYHNNNRSAKYLKGQICGPVSVGMYLTDANGKLAYYDQHLRELIVKNLEAQALWQGMKFKSLGSDAIISVDDPGIFAYGNSTYVGLQKEMIMEDLDTIFSSLKQNQIVTGAHCCAGADWSILLEQKLDICFFDAYEYFNSLLPYGEAINEFLARGGILGWGIVPTSKSVWEEDRDSLAKRIEQGMKQLINLGVDAKRIRENWVITPSCGTGLLEIETAKRCYKLAEEVVDLLK